MVNEFNLGKDALFHGKQGLDLFFENLTKFAQ